MAHANEALSITEERTFSAKLGERTITGLSVASAWEGFTKYTDRAGQHLIVLDAEQRIITASPDLIAQLGVSASTIQFNGMLFGTPCAGGYFAGVIDVYGQRHALIVAGAEGELVGEWIDPASTTSGTHYQGDGVANTFAMARAGSKLAQAAQALTIGGHDDWYIPSRDELDLIYRAFKPTTTRNYADGEDGVNASSVPAHPAHTKDFPTQTAAENFRAGGKDALLSTWYWSSTQYAATPNDAWGQSFDDGDQNYGHKSYAGRARAVRRLPIQ